MSKLRVLLVGWVPSRQGRKEHTHSKSLHPTGLI